MCVQPSSLPIGKVSELEMPFCVCHSLQSSLECAQEDAILCASHSLQSLLEYAQEEAILCASHSLQSSLEYAQGDMIVQIDFCAHFYRVNHRGTLQALLSAGINCRFCATYSNTVSL